MPKKIRLFDVIDFDSTTGSFVELKDGLIYEIESKMSSYGTTFTPSAATHLINEQAIKIEANAKAGVDETMAIEFSKLALLEILMQDGCEGIRFVKCKALKPDNSGINPDEESLVAMGLDSNGELIGKEWFNLDTSKLGDGPMPIVTEKGNTVPTSKVKKEINS